jgi:hypothetical protein
VAEFFAGLQPESPAIRAALESITDLEVPAGPLSLETLLPELNAEQCAKLRAFFVAWCASTTHQRAGQCLHLRLCGCDCKEIAERLGYASVQLPHYHVRNLIQNVPALGKAFGAMRTIYRERGPHRPRV